VILRIRYYQSVNQISGDLNEPRVKSPRGHDFFDLHEHYTTAVFRRLGYGCNFAFTDPELHIFPHHLIDGTIFGKRII
jgi:hypothetical protein